MVNRIRAVSLDGKTDYGSLVVVAAAATNAATLPPGDGCAPRDSIVPDQLSVDNESLSMSTHVDSVSPTRVNVPVSADGNLCFVFVFSFVSIFLQARHFLVGKPNSLDPIYLLILFEGH